MIIPEDFGKMELPYTKRVDSPDSSTTYIGLAENGSETSESVWRIQKIYTSGTETTMTWADGDTKFDNVWDDRTTLSYS